ncbi:protein-L-isoaspartate O-methyltransferase [Streptomyces sp. NPDC002018]|uniref:protein-L-isoaspartate O-methyltransferase family protein n=1 Tax=Streptomyces sp. NPDC002018 TaxID=3364629 RepID=UPI0036A869AF
MADALRLRGAGYHPVAVIGDGSQGRPESAPYDRVLITASLREIPAEIIRQTRPGGIIVCPYATEYGGRPSSGSPSGRTVAPQVLSSAPPPSCGSDNNAPTEHTSRNTWAASHGRPTAAVRSPPSRRSTWLPGSPCSPSGSRQRGCSPTRSGTTTGATRSGSGTPR